MSKDKTIMILVLALVGLAALIIILTLGGEDKTPADSGPVVADDNGKPALNGTPDDGETPGDTGSTTVGENGTEENGETPVDTGENGTDTPGETAENGTGTTPGDTETPGDTAENGNETPGETPGDTPGDTTPKAGHIRVAITDETDAPISGASLQVYANRESLDPKLGRLNPVITLYADESGIAESDLPPGIYRLTAEAEGYESKIAGREVVRLAAGDNKDLKVQLRKGGILFSGVAVDENGLGIPQVQIDVYVIQDIDAESLSTFSDAYGRFQFKGLSNEKNYGIQAEKEGYAKYMVFPIEIKDGYTIELSAGGFIAGRLSLAETGEPVTDFTMRWFYTEFVDNSSFSRIMIDFYSSEYARRTVRHPNGEFKFGGLGSGKHTVIFMSEFGTVVMTDVAIDPPQTTIVEAFVEPNGIIKGTVTDKASGLPVPGAEIGVLFKVIVPLATYAELRTRTLEDGTYILKNVPRAKGTLRASIGETVTGDKDYDFGYERELSIDFELDSGGGTIRGIVMNTDGKPIKGVLVIARVSTGLTSARTQTDENGEFIFEKLAEASYVVAPILADGKFLAEVVEVKTGEVTVVDFKEERGATIRGTITDSGTPVPGLQVFLADLDMSAPKLRRLRLAHTNAKGEYELENVPTGRFRLSYFPGGLGGSKSGYKDIEVKGLDEIVVDFLLEGIKVTGRIIDADGNPLASATVILRKIPANEVIRSGADFMEICMRPGSSDAEGCFELEAPEPGRYRIQIAKYVPGSTEGAYAHYFVEGVEVKENESVDVGDIVMVAGHMLDLEFADPEGNPIPRGLYCFFTPDGRNINMLGHPISDGKPKHGITPLSPGVYRFFVAAPGYIGVRDYPVEVTEEETTKAKITLRPAGTLSVKVIDVSGEPVEGARISIVGPDGEILVNVFVNDDFFRAPFGTTNNKGVFETDSAPPGNCTVSVQLGGNPVVRNIAVTKGETVELELVLADIRR